MRNEGLGSWPARRARMAPDRTALIFGERSWTYGELHLRVTRLAHALRGLGVGRGDRVGYLGPNHPAFLETLFATGALGAVLVPLNHRLTAPELDHALGDSGTGVLVYAPQHAAVAAELATPGLRPVSLAGDYENLLAGAATEPIDEPCGLDDVSMIMYTSGTTSRPKGAMITHGNVIWNCANVLVDVDLTRDEVTLISAPLFHTAALNMTCLPTLLKGATAVIMPAFTPAAAFDLIERHRVTWMFGVPAMFAAMAGAARWAAADLSSLRILICGGAPVPGVLIETFRARGLTFLQGYGMTETAPGALFLGPEFADRVGSAGKPSFFTDVRLAAADEAPAPPDGAGARPREVLVKGPNVMKGYWGRPDATREAFTDDGWFRSGDAAVVDGEGFFTIVDRIKDVIISGGENIYPAEVEAALYEHPAVAECAVIGVPDQRWGEVGKAVVVLRPDARADASELLAALTGRLAKYKIPKSVEFIDALPRNGAGKVVKQRLRAPGRPITP